MSNLISLKIKSMQLYFTYKDGIMTLEDYLLQIKPLDKEIDYLEVQALSCHLGDNLAFEKSFLKQLHL